MSLIPFAFEGAPVRIVTQEDAPWFVLADVCRILEISNTGNASARLDDDEKTTIRLTDTLIDQGFSNSTPGTQLTIISEPGMYRLVMRSDKPAAKRFQKWVVSEVLPSIRKSGGYGVQTDPMKVLNDPTALRTVLLGYTEKVIALEAKVEQMAPTIAAFDRIASAEGSLCITDAAKSLQLQPKKLFSWMHENKWLYGRGGASQNIAYQNRIHQGYLEHKITIVMRSDGTEKTVTQVRVTPKGLARLAKEFPVPEGRGNLPEPRR